MGYYITNAQLKARFESTADVSSATDSTDPAVPVEAALTDAVTAGEATMHRYLGRRYALPIVIVGDLVLTGLMESCALDLAECLLLTRNERVSEAKEKRCDGWIKWLEEVAEGDADLPGVEPPDPAVVTATSFAWGDNDAEIDDEISERQFTRATLDEL